MKRFLLTRRANQYKRHIGGSWYSVMFEACHYGLAGFRFAGFRVRPGMTRFIVFPGWINVWRVALLAVSRWLLPGLLFRFDPGPPLPEYYD